MKNFVKRKNGQFIGLLVRRTYAERFLNGKSLEIRTRPLKFLGVGERIILVSCGQKEGGRRALATLQFTGCFQISLASFSTFQATHKLDDDEMEAMSSQTRKKDKDHLWGWQLTMVHQFSEPVPVPTTTAEVWMHFTLDQLQAMGVFTNPVSPL